MKKGFTLIELFDCGIDHCHPDLYWGRFVRIGQQTIPRCKTKGEILSNCAVGSRCTGRIMGVIQIPVAGSWADASGLSTALVPTYLPSIPSDPKSTQAYRFEATNISSGNYYGYCLSTLIESDNPADTCTPDTNNSHNYGAKSSLMGSPSSNFSYL